MKYIDLLKSAYRAEDRSGVEIVLPEHTESVFVDHRDQLVSDALSIMCCPNDKPLRPPMITVEFDDHDMVDFAELRRGFADGASARGWAARAIRHLNYVPEQALPCPCMRTTVHEGQLTFWRTWSESIDSLTTLAIWQVGQPSFDRHVITLSIARRPWLSGQGARPGSASYPHYPDEWAGWNTAAESVLNPACRHRIPAFPQLIGISDTKVPELLPRRLPAPQRS